MTHRRLARLDRWWDLITLAGTLALALCMWLAVAVILIVLVLVTLAGPK